MRKLIRWSDCIWTSDDKHGNVKVTWSKYYYPKMRHYIVTIKDADIMKIFTNQKEALKFAKSYLV